MLRVTVYPHNIKSAHLSQIYTGLYDLEAEGKIILDFTLKFPLELRKSRPHVTLWIRVEDLKNSRSRNICFDMHDSGRNYALERLRLCDIYFKRSYHQKYFEHLPDQLRTKIFPYGLNYACSSKNQRHTLKRLLIFNRINKNFKKHPVRTFREISRQLIKASITRLNISYFTLYPPLESQFEILPDEPAEAKVLFQTRLWEPFETRKIPSRQLGELNEMRANTVRALRNEFGDHFIGGLYPTPFAKKNYPDCLTSQNTHKSNYMNLVKKCLIAVTTTGLHDSIGWKLPEYLAASRCIITEPLKYSLPASLEEGKNYLLFRTPKECVKNANKLLTDQRFAANIRHNNYKYYVNHIKPSALVQNCLETSFKQ